MIVICYTDGKDDDDEIQSCGCISKLSSLKFEVFVWWLLIAVYTQVISVMWQAVMKNHLVEPILNVLLPIMCSEEEEEEEEEPEPDAESHTAPQYALQVSCLRDAPS